MNRRITFDRSLFGIQRSFRVISIIYGVLSKNRKNWWVEEAYMRESLRCEKEKGLSWFFGEIRFIYWILNTVNFVRHRKGRYKRPVDWSAGVVFSWGVSATDWGREAAVINPLIGARNSNEWVNLDSRGGGDRSNKSEEFHVRLFVINYNNKAIFIKEFIINF